MGRISGKAAVVFGAGSLREGWGNGQAAATLYAREGARVVVVDKELTLAQATVNIIKAEGFEASAVEADVSVAADVEAAITASIALYGQIDILHNNVGLFEMTGIEATSEASWDFIMDVNLKGMFLACKAALPHMVARKSGAIVNISSIGGIRWLGQPAIAYHVTKAAVNRLTQSVAMEYARLGIRCNAVMPGFINTPMVAGAWSKRLAGSPPPKRSREELVPMGHVGDAWDVAYASLFLASDEARYITGVLLPVDGGSVLTI